MKIDITLKVTPRMVQNAQGNEKKALNGHLGTHFDVMNQVFPLDFTERKGIVFDISHIKEREVILSDIDCTKISADMFVAFYSGYIEEVEYGTQAYFKEHPVLSREVIEYLIEKKVSLIGIDFAGVRRGKEHTPCDQYCADHGIFIIENLCNLKELCNQECLIHTYPMNFTQMSGLPCRVVAEVEV